MKLIITESKLNRAITKWLNEFYGDLDSSSTNDIIRYRDKSGSLIFLYHPGSRMVELTQKLTDEMVSVFGINGSELRPIFVPWLKERYNIKVKIVTYTTWYCVECGRYHITKHHTE